jgi:LCP family protein required for cell wall assembly
MEMKRSRRQAAVARTGRRYWLVGISALSVLLVALAGWQAWRFWTRPFSSEAPAPVEATDSEKFTVLVLGADDRPGEPGRTDTMMVAFADLGQGTVKLLSLPRDSYVSIPGHGWDKLNAAYPLGKTDLTRQTVEKLIGIPVNYTIEVNMQGFEQIVDAVGGVDITIDENMDYEDPSDNPPLVIHLKKGDQHLYGVDALHYVRFRHDAESDWGRMKRQQTFLSALAKAVEKPENLARLPQVLKIVTQNVKTNLSPSQLSKLAAVAKSKTGGEHVVSAGTLTGDDIWSSYGYYLGLHFTEMRAQVRELAGLPDDAAATAKDAKDAALYAANLPRGSATAESPTPSAPPEGTTTGTEPAKTGEDGKTTTGDGKSGPGAGTPGTGTPGSGTAAPGTGTPGTGTPGTGTSVPGTGAPGTGTPTTPQPGTGTTTPAPGTGTPGTPAPGTGSGSGSGMNTGTGTGTSTGTGSKTGTKTGTGTATGTATGAKTSTTTGTTTLTSGTTARR